MAHGRLFFELHAPGNWVEGRINDYHTLAEAAIINVVPKEVRNSWLDLNGVPTSHDEMHAYLQTKVNDLHLTIIPNNPATAAPPTGYCYIDDLRICYHPHELIYESAVWNVKPPLETVWLSIMLVLAYETNLHA